MGGIVHFTLTNQGAQNLTKAFTGLATLPFAVSLQDKKLEQQGLQNAFLNQLRVAQGNLTKARSDEVNQRMGFLNDAVNAADPTTMNRYLAAGGKRPVFAYAQAKNMPGYSFDKSTGKLIIGDDAIAQETGSALHAALSGVGVDGNPIANDMRNFAIGALNGKTYAPYSMTADGSVVLNKGTGATQIGDRGSYNLKQSEGKAKVAEHNAKAAYARAGVPLRKAQTAAAIAKAKKPNQSGSGISGADKLASASEVKSAFADTFTYKDPISGQDRITIKPNTEKIQQFYREMNNAGAPITRGNLYKYLGGYRPGTVSAPKAQPSPAISLTEDQRTKLTNIQNLAKEGKISKDEAIARANRVAPGLIK